MASFKKLLLWIVPVIIVAVTIFFFVFKNRRGPEKVKIRLPSGEIIEAVRAPRMKPEERKKVLAVTLEGKIEEVRTSVLPNDTTTRIVLIANDGELIMLVGPTSVNTLRYGGYIGSLVKLKGYWYGKLSFRGKYYRSMWVEEIFRV